MPPALQPRHDVLRQPVQPLEVALVALDVGDRHSHLIHAASRCPVELFEQASCIPGVEVMGVAPGAVSVVQAQTGEVVEDLDLLSAVRGITV